jgi:hypothetical protein
VADQGSIFHDFSRDVGDDASEFDTEPVDWLTELVKAAPSYGPDELPVPNGRVTVALSDIQMRPIQWLWPLRVAYGKLTIIEGDPGTGKTTITLNIAARVSAGASMPLEPRVASNPAGVVMVCAEDDMHDTVIPRLLAAGADLTRVGSVLLSRDEAKQLIPLTIPEDMARLEQAIGEWQAKLMVIDPITAYMSGSINTANDAQVRRAMLPLGDLAQKTGCAIVLIRHLNKATDMKAKHRGGGSIAFTGAARSVMVCDKHPEKDTLVMARVKNNLAAVTPSLTYQMVTDELYDCPAIRWTGVDSIDADALVRGKDARVRAPDREEAKDWLREALADGARKAVDLFKEAEAEGVTKSTLKAAKSELGVETFRLRDPKGGFTIGWVWCLPEHAAALRGAQRPDPSPGNF